MNLPTPRPQPLSKARFPAASMSRRAASGQSTLLPHPPSSTDAPLRLHPGYVDFLRQRLHAQRPRIAFQPLEQFATQVFADDLMVECYFHARHRRAGAGSNQTPPCLIPLEEACRAARSAERMGVLASFERPLASLAALAQVCHLARPLPMESTT